MYGEAPEDSMPEEAESLSCDRNVLEGASMKIPRVDAPVKSFVMKLNRIKGVYPASSCGGHDNPGGSRQPKGEFFVIMRIWNGKFMERLMELYKENESFCGFRYHPIHETWCLSGFIFDKDDLFEPLVDEFLSNPENVKNEEEWTSFYSYTNTPPHGTDGMSNSVALSQIPKKSIRYDLC